MTRRTLITIVVLVLVAFGAFAWMGVLAHNAPAGQPPLSHLDAGSLATLKADFNRAAGATRMIVLLSPT